MKYYQVTVNILTSDEKGKKTSKDFEYTFNDANLLTARNKAIAKVQELEEEFMYGKEQYDSFFVAQMKGFKNFKAYSIDLLFVPNNNWEYCLYGEDEEQTIEGLKAEVDVYAEKDGIALTEIEYEDGEWDYVYVIEDNIDFFIN